MNTKKLGRRQRAASRLEAQLTSGVHNVTALNFAKIKQTAAVPLAPQDKDRIKSELETLTDRIAGKKKPARVKKIAVAGTVQEEGPRWMIDIFGINYSRVKRTQRKKNKGASRKKMRTVKSVSFVKTVVAQPGMITAYREGKMGLSPKTNMFRLRKEDEVRIN